MENTRKAKRTKTYNREQKAGNLLWRHLPTGKLYLTIEEYAKTGPNKAKLRFPRTIVAMERQPWKYDLEMVDSLTGRVVTWKPNVKSKQYAKILRVDNVLDIKSLKGHPVLNRETGEIYKSIALAAKFLDMNYDTLKYQLTKAKRNKTNLKIYEIGNRR